MYRSDSYLAGEVHVHAVEQRRDAELTLISERNGSNERCHVHPSSISNTLVFKVSQSPAEISTAAVAEAVAAREVDDKGIVTTGPVAVDQTLARRQTSLKIKTAWQSLARTANDEMSFVMDFAKNGHVPDLKEQPGSTHYYYYSSTFILGMVNHAHGKG